MLSQPQAISTAVLVTSVNAARTTVETAAPNQIYTVSQIRQLHEFAA